MKPAWGRRCPMDPWPQHLRFTRDGFRTALAFAWHVSRVVNSIILRICALHVLNCITVPSLCHMAIGLHVLRCCALHEGDGGFAPVGAGPLPADHWMRAIARPRPACQRNSWQLHADAWRPRPSRWRRAGLGWSMLTSKMCRAMQFAHL